MTQEEIEKSEADQSKADDLEENKN